MLLKSVKILVRGSNEIVELKMPRGFLVKIYKRKSFYEITLDYEGKKYTEFFWGSRLNKEWQLYALKQVLAELIENAQIWVRGDADDRQSGRLLGET